MVGKKLKTYLIGRIFGTRGFSGSLITNLNLKSENQNGGSNMADKNVNIYLIEKIFDTLLACSVTDL